MLLTIYHIVSGNGNIYKAYRLALAGSRSGVARNAHTIITAQLLTYAQRHFAGGFAADSTVFGQRICLYIEQLLLGHVSVADNASQQILAAARHICNQAAGKTAAAGFRKGNSFALLQQLLP